MGIIPATIAPSPASPDARALCARGQLDAGILSEPSLALLSLRSRPF